MNEKLRVTFYRSGKAPLSHFDNIKYLHGRNVFNDAQLAEKTNEILENWKKPVHVTAYVLREASDFIDVRTSSLSLHEYHPQKSSFFRLFSNGNVSFFWKGWKKESDEEQMSMIMAGKAETGDFGSDPPTWSINFSAHIWPTLEQMFLAARFDKGSAFGRVPIDVVRIIARIVAKNRTDLCWKK